MGLYRMPRSPFWWASYTGPDGRRVRVSTRLTARRVAEEWLARRRTAVALARADHVSGIAPAESSSAAGGTRVVSVADAVRAYGIPWADRYRERSAAYGANADAILTELLAVLGPDRRLASITASAVAETADRLAARGRAGKRAGATVDRHLSALRMLLTAAAEDGAIQGVPSFRRARRGTQVRTWVPNEAQVARMIALARPPLRRAIILATETGLRRGEMAELTSGSVDLEGRRLTVSRAKGGQGRTVPLSPAALAVVRELLAVRAAHPTTGAPVLLLDDDGDPYRPAYSTGERAAWKRLLVAAGVPTEARARWHDLRAYAATRLHRLGMAPDAVRRMLGHRSWAAHQRYLRLAADDVQNALDSACETRQTSGRVNAVDSAPEISRSRKGVP